MALFALNLSNGATSNGNIFRLMGLLVSGSGVMQSGSLLVAAQGTPDMTVKVAGDTTGHDAVFVTDTGETYHGWNTADENVTITANGTGVTQIDTIVAYIDLAGGSATADNPAGFVFEAVRGTAGVAPTSSEIETAIGAANPYIELADISVSNGASSINSGNITDVRVRAVIGNNLVTSSSLQQAFFKGRYQSDNSDSVASADQSGLTVQFGWVQINGNGTQLISQAVTFPTAFSTVLFVIPGMLAASSGAASGITGLTSNLAGGAGYTPSAADITTTGFNLDIVRHTNNFGAGTYFGASWIAIGTI